MEYLNHLYHKGCYFIKVSNFDRNVLDIMVLSVWDSFLFCLVIKLFVSGKLTQYKLTPNNIC